MLNENEILILDKKGKDVKKSKEIIYLNEYTFSFFIHKYIKKENISILLTFNKYKSIFI